MPAIARLADPHLCPKSEGSKPHVGGPVKGPCAKTVLAEGGVIALKGDELTCVGPADSIAIGIETVMIEGVPVADSDAPTSHGGRIVTSCHTVRVG
jgi:uncharacterized Zn-binding protein involved in type VI secretion